MNEIAPSAVLDADGGLPADVGPGGSAGYEEAFAGSGVYSDDGAKASTDTDDVAYADDDADPDDITDIEDGEDSYDGAGSFPAVNTDDPERELSSTVALFEGDEGGLELDQRRALVVLLKQRFISARTHPREWAALIANPSPIRARLNDLFMELCLDRDREVAYKRQVVTAGGGRPFPTLLFDAPWGREETVLLVYLRNRHRLELAAGQERAYVDREDMLDFVAQHRPKNATDESGDAKKTTRAIEGVHKSGLLLGGSASDRFEISDAIEVLIPVEKLLELTRWLKEQNTAGEPGAEDLENGNDR